MPIYHWGLHCYQFPETISYHSNRIAYYKQKRIKF